MSVWSCKIGDANFDALPDGADLPMRKAVERAYFDLTGKWPDFNFSGWGANLTPSERDVVERRKRNGLRPSSEAGKAKRLSCPKCGGSSITTRYHEFARPYDHCEGTEYGTEEHLDRCCDNCGYTWATATISRPSSETGDTA